MLARSERALVQNGALYTLWNARKEALQRLAPWSEETLQRELRLTARCLSSNPKLYCVWYPNSALLFCFAHPFANREHRRFVVAQKISPELVAKELALCDKFHTHDSRNFHCWNYRRWLAQLGGVDSKAELEYSLKRINEGFFQETKESNIHFFPFPVRFQQLQRLACALACVWSCGWGRH